MADSEVVGTGVSAATAPAPPSPSPLDEAEVLDIAAAVKKKRRQYRHKKFGCTVAEHIMKAVASTKERRRLSVAAMKKMLSPSGYNLARSNSRVNRTVRSRPSKGSLEQTAGSEASGSAKLSNSLEETTAETPKMVLTKKSMARKSRRLKATSRKRCQRMKRLDRHRKKYGAVKRSTRWKAVRVKKVLAIRRVSRKPKEAAKSPSQSVNPTGLDVKPTPSKHNDSDMS
ncbi:histone H1-like [Hypanus sabinus]|uniref:histone H1-like n=1 Tax=Hypanus sabinus TaxID=79690 RepID=UPI0028C41E5C|nr:histone H1-like [Hypanus sabinus]